MGPRRTGRSPRCSPTRPAGTATASGSAATRAPLTFGARAAQTAATARALREAGVRHGDLVMVTLRTTPPYLLCWLALASIGAVTVSANPRSAPAELAGLAHQTSPRAIITDAGLVPAGHRGGHRRPARARRPGRR